MLSPLCLRQEHANFTTPGRFGLDANEPFPDSESHQAVGKGLKVVRSPSEMNFIMMGTLCLLPVSCSCNPVGDRLGALPSFQRRVSP